MYSTTLGGSQHFGFRIDQGHAGFEIRGLDVGQKAPFEAGLETIFQCEDFLGRPVGCEDDLFARFVQGVESVEKFLLGADLAGDELDIVHQQQVGHAVFFPEGSYIAPLDGADQLVGEIVALDIDDAVGRAGAGDVTGDGIEKVGFAQTGLAVDKQGVIGTGRFLRYGIGGRMGKLVAAAHDEALKSVVGIDGIFVGRLP